MTWVWGFVDRTTIVVRSPSGEDHPLSWSDHDSEYPGANGWTWNADPPSGDRPKAVYDLVVENDVAAALTEDIERDDSAFGDT